MNHCEFCTKAGVRMHHLINPSVRNIEISGIRKFFNLLSEYPEALSLTLGQPDFPTPDHVKTAAKAAIDHNRTTYTPNAGLGELRQAISSFQESRYQLKYDPHHEVIVTNGASEAIDITLRTILEPGTEVILPGPVYPGYEPIIRLAGAIPIHIDTRDRQFRLTARDLRDHLTERTRCVILPYPSNPTGAVLSHAELAEIAKVLKDRDVFVLSDEIYSELVYDDAHVSIAAYPGLREKTIVVNGLSKSHSMTGWRIGYTCAPRYISQQMLKVHQYNSTCASSISQYAALEALTHGLDDPLHMKEAYLQRRNYVYERLQGMNLAVNLPAGAFYFFPDISEFGLSSQAFALHLLKVGGVAAVPGDAFSALGEGYIRISYAYAFDTLREGMDRIERVVTALRGH
jgi:aminotransferase